MSEFFESLPDESQALFRHAAQVRQILGTSELSAAGEMQRRLDEDPEVKFQEDVRDAERAVAEWVFGTFLKQVGDPYIAAERTKAYLEYSNKEFEFTPKSLGRLYDTY